MQNVKGTMTNAVVKPATKDKDGYPKDNAYLALTFKIDLKQFTDAELGNILVTSANGDEVAVMIEASQLLMDIPDPNLVTPVSDND